MFYGIIVHGGAGSPVALSDGCRAACEAGIRILEGGGNALDAAIEAVRGLEDDGRYNAGSGSVLRLDGKTIEMDASVMDSAGRLGAVAAIRNVKNPVLVARAVMETPHVMLAGEGAELFARRAGFPHYYHVSEMAKKSHEKLKALLRKEGLEGTSPLWAGTQLEKIWNFRPGYEEFLSGDTVGAVALDKRGLLAAAGSTGGSTPMLLGRVGDTPLAGCGFYAGPLLAAAATGTGEEIIKKMLCKTVYESFATGTDLKKACDDAIRSFPEEFPAGIIAISKSAFAVSSNREMAFHHIVS
jgi:L-asparaginase/beta-aspartyl-peptidase (threonine type)